MTRNRSLFILPLNFVTKLHFHTTTSPVLNYRAVRKLLAEGKVALATTHFFQNPNSYDANLLISKRLISLEDSFRAYQLLKEKSLLNYFVMISLVSYYKIGDHHHDKSVELWNGLSMMMVSLQEEYRKKVNPTTWNYMIRGFCHTGHVSTVFELLKYIKRNRFPVEPIAFSSLLSALAVSTMSEKAKEVYYSMKECFGVSPDIIHFNCLIKALIESGEIEEAMEIYKQEKDLKPNEVTYVILLKGCAITQSKIHGKELYETVMKNPELISNISVQNNRINMFTKCGETQTAIEIFNKMLERKLIDDVTWTLIIPAYLEEERLEEIEGLLISEGVSSVYVFNVLMGSILKCGNFEHAESIFNQMEFKDIVTWNSFLNGLSESGDTERLMIYFNNMPKYIQPNEVTTTILLNYFANQSMEQEACFMFDNMCNQFKITRNTAHYGCMIKLWANLKNMRKATTLYEEMINNNLVSDVPTLILLLSICSEFGNLVFGKILHRNIRNQRIIDNKLMNVLVDMYAQCGDLQSAHEVFQSIPYKDVVSWTTLINAYGMHGIGRKAIELFNQMNQEGDVKPNEHTLTCILNACGHSEMVELAKEIFNNMESKYSIKPTNKHIACLIDALTRGGDLTDAEKLLDSCTSPDVVTVSTLLGACRKFNNVALAEKLFHMLIERNEVETSHFILMANIYTSLDMLNDAKRVRELMEFGGFKKLPSTTQVCVEGQVHSFVCEEKDHPDMKVIENELKNMMNDLVNAGYQPDLSWVIKNIDNNAEKLDLLYRHSEKIALAYVFSKQPIAPGIIHLTNNLRVCGDCHNAIKLLSSVRKCEIMIRDPSRFHHFKDGVCSCNDYW